MCAHATTTTRARARRAASCEAVVFAAGEATRAETTRRSRRVVRGRGASEAKAKDRDASLPIETVGAHRSPLPPLPPGVGRYLSQAKLSRTCSASRRQRPNSSSDVRPSSVHAQSSSAWPPTPADASSSRSCPVPGGARQLPPRWLPSVRRRKSDSLSPGRTRRVSRRGRRHIARAVVAVVGHPPGGVASVTVGARKETGRDDGDESILLWGLGGEGDGARARERARADRAPPLKNRTIARHAARSLKRSLAEALAR